MRRDPVTSTNIAEIGYDEPSRTLEVLYLNGGLYQYFDVAPQVYEELKRSSSKGQYLNAQIKGRYRYARI
ncbi:MAG: KTSC domain-containing protein [Acidobacteriota bacterium]|nr:KTSC domain-containing protein [Acidobacteriota bacterium]